MKDLKIAFKQVENVILMKVLEQDESTRGADKLFTSGKTSIRSSNRPQLHGDVIFVRGKLQNFDDKWVAIELNDVEAATEFLKKYQRVIAEYNAKMNDGFTDGMGYYFINSDLGIMQHRWESSPFDKAAHLRRNAFHTLKEAQQKQKIMNFIFDREKVFTQEEWENTNIMKYHVYVNQFNEVTTAGFHSPKCVGSRCFPTEEIAQEVADFLTVEDVYKYL